MNVIRIDEGTYRARARSWELGFTESGKEQIWIELEIVDEGSVVATERISWYGYFTDKTFDSTIRALRTMGWTGFDLSDLQGLDANEVEIVVEHEEYPAGSGKLYPRVRWVNRPGAGGMKKPMSPEEKRAFASHVKGRIVAADQSSGNSTARPRQASPLDERPPPTDRDAPPTSTSKPLPF